MTKDNGGLNPQSINRNSSSQPTTTADRR